MKRLLTIRGLLAGLALVGLLLSPLARPAMAMTSGAAMQDMAANAAADLADMPCCPDDAAKPDCAKDCPFMAMCTAKVFTGLANAGVTAPLSLAMLIVPVDAARLSGFAQGPPPKPPKA